MLSPPFRRHELSQTVLYKQHIEVTIIRCVDNKNDKYLVFRYQCRQTAQKKTLGLIQKELVTKGDDFNVMTNKEKNTDFSMG